AVLCHEIAHIKRHDALTQFLASLAAAIYWFNPFVWLVVRGMRVERERACDDYVLASGTMPSEYAHELLEIVSTLVRPQPAAALAMARRSQLEGRVLALVNPRVKHGVLTAGVAMLLGSAVFAVALPLAALKLQERPADESITRIVSVMPPRTETIRAIAVPVSHASVPEPPKVPAATDEQAAGVGIPVYPKAVAGEHFDGRGTVSLVDGAHVHRLAASAYFSDDMPDKVLQFYRDQLKSYGHVVECRGGANTKVDVQLNEESLADPLACRANDFADGGTELKVAALGDERIVVVRPHASGSEIALVRLPAGVDDADSDIAQGNQVISSSSDCLEGHSNSSSSNSHTDDNGSRTWTATWTRGPCSIEARSSGTVRFNTDATAIESISSGGYFEVSERVGDTLRRVRVEPGSNGQLAYTYKLNGNQQEFDAAGRAWFSNLLLRLERVTGFAADTRVPALLRKGGPQAVLDEISQLQSDYVRQVYFIKLFENATLPAPMLVKALDQARNEISTDYSLAQVLLTIAQRYDLNDEAQRTAFLNGANKLGTDYEHARVLIELLKRPNLSEQIVRGALASAKSIGTDYEKGRILTTLVGLSSFNESEIGSYLDLASSIGTDYEHSRTLMALMEHQKLTPAAVSQILKSASSIGTDYEKSRILIALSQSNNFDEKQIATYLTLVDSVSTDYERSRDLISLMQQHKLANDSVARIFAETQKIGTDYEKARVLTEAARRYQIQGALRDAYIKAADSIGTEYDRNRTLAAITKQEMM
ncbi:MAG TPA: M56 family metallopeptidase, partial [Terriglobales bacterium]|nr:M56 family metallopeptidase [Terriglobales bacterium]